MNNIRHLALLPLMLLASSALAGGYQTIPLTDGGMRAGYAQVPAGFECNISVPEDPTVLCQGPGGVHYHTASLGSFQYAVDPQQAMNHYLQQIAAHGNARLIGQRQVPEITQHMYRLDQPLLFKQGMHLTTYAFDFEHEQDNRLSTALFLIYILPNNGAPMSWVESRGVSLPASRGPEFDAIRQDFFRYLLSTRYDPQYVQALNNQYMTNQGRLQAQQRAFNEQQRQFRENSNAINESIMGAYQSRNESMDRSHQQYVDSIYDRRQMTDPSSGTRYEVEGNYEYNYVNPNDPDVYMQTDDALLDPNVNTNAGEEYILLEEE